MNLEDLIDYRTSLGIPIGDEELEKSPFYVPEKDSEILDYLIQKREKLGGFLPKRIAQKIDIKLPEWSTFS